MSGEALLGKAVLGEAMLGETVLGEAMLEEAVLGKAVFILAYTLAQCRVEPAKNPPIRTSLDERWHIPPQRSVSVLVRSRAGVIITHTPSTSDACETHLIRRDCQPNPSALLTTQPLLTQPLLTQPLRVLTIPFYLSAYSLYTGF
jgi:hypothetical protein